MLFILSDEAKAREEIIEEGWLRQSQSLCRAALRKLRRHAQRYRKVGMYVCICISLSSIAL